MKRFFLSALRLSGVIPLFPGLFKTEALEQGICLFFRCVEPGGKRCILFPTFQVERHQLRCGTGGAVGFEIHRLSVAYKAGTVIGDGINNQLTVVCGWRGQCRIQRAIQTNHPLQVFPRRLDKQQI
ncbi:Uncharacterised protein [Klebsiella pneumoniae]|nr:Uncharacterised protein [Klebsiella pneumoniae]